MYFFFFLLFWRRKMLWNTSREKPQFTKKLFWSEAQVIPILDYYFPSKFHFYAHFIFACLVLPAVCTQHLSEIIVPIQGHGTCVMFALWTSSRFSFNGYKGGYSALKGFPQVIFCPAKLSDDLHSWMTGCSETWIKSNCLYKISLICSTSRKILLLERDEESELLLLLLTKNCGVKHRWTNPKLSMILIAWT